MKVLKILAVVFGALLVLTGGGLLVAGSLASTGQNAIDSQIAKSGFTGPVEGVVIGVEQGTLVTATFTDDQGEAHTGRGVAAGGSTPKVGDTVSLYYSTDDPEQIIIYNVPGGSLTSIGGSLRTAGIVCLIVGGLLLIAGIVGLVTGKKAAPALPAGAYPGGPPNQPPPGYPTQAYGQQPPPGYPNQPPYGNQPPPPYGNQPPPPPYGNQQPPVRKPAAPTATSSRHRTETSPRRRRQPAPAARQPAPAARQPAARPRPTERQAGFRGSWATRRRSAPPLGRARSDPT